MPMPFLLKNSDGTTEPIAGVDKGVDKGAHNFPKGISPKVNLLIMISQSSTAATTPRIIDR